MQLRHIPREVARAFKRMLGFKPPLPEELGLITADLRPGDTFVDVGANTGLFALHAARKVGPTGKVLAIEPNPSIVGQLRSTMTGLANVSIDQVAVGDKRGTATLHVFKQHTRSSLLKDGRASRYTLDERNRVEPITVEVEPLLSILSRRGIEKIDALKIDIEGYEDRALMPFFEAAPENLWPRRVLMERSPHVWEQDCIAFMHSLGYASMWEGRGDVLLHRTFKQPQMKAGAS
jgi:FkbM family methyltransferase